MIRLGGGGGAEPNKPVNESTETPAAMTASLDMVAYLGIFVALVLLIALLYRRFKKTETNDR